MKDIAVIIVLSVACIGFGGIVSDIRQWLLDNYIFKFRVLKDFTCYRPQIRTWTGWKDIKKRGENGEYHFAGTEDFISAEKVISDYSYERSMNPKSKYPYKFVCK
jgi:hypothetical protein